MAVESGTQSAKLKQGPTKDTTERKRRARFGMFSLLLTALFAGIGTGLFLGDYAGSLSIVGDAYVGLLQMTVLPYIVCSVIGNIGRLTVHESKRLALTGLVVMAVLWIIGLATVWIVSMALPNVPAGSFFSTSLLDPPRNVDFLNLFIPANPFFALSQNYAPAVVIFCIFVGFALIHVKDRDNVLGFFETANSTLSRVNTYIVRLSPIGIFAISASSTGTMTLEEFGRLQAYFVVFIGSVVLLTFWVLPMLVAAVTPFRYRDLLATQGNVLITSFVIGSVFVVIPMLVESIRDLMEQSRRDGVIIEVDQRTSSNPEFIVPLAYPFPHLGKLVTLIFVPFAAWFYGQPMEATDYPLMLTTGLFLSFGKVTTTIPFLLDMQKIPSDVFQLFMMSSVVAGRFNDLLGAAHLLAFTAITTCAMSGYLAINRLKLVFGGLTTVFVTGLLIAGTQHGLRTAFSNSFSREEVISEMNLLQDQVPQSVLAIGEPNPVPLKDGMTRRERIVATGKIRIGFHPDNLPFSYYNARGELVGLDVDLAHRLARDLGVEIVFVPFSFASLREQVADDHFDVVMSGLSASIAYTQFSTITETYLDLNLALVVRDYQRRDFSNLDFVRNRKSLVVGAKHNSVFARKIRRLFPNATIVPLWSESEFFEGAPRYLDALVTSAEGGSAWTLIHPSYQVVNPLDRNVSVPIAFMLPYQEAELEGFLNLWIELKRQDGTIRDLYDYWILGRGAEAEVKRWSIIRDVLGWVD